MKYIVSKIDPLANIELTNVNLNLEKRCNSYRISSTVKSLNIYDEQRSNNEPETNVVYSKEEGEEGENDYQILSFLFHYNISTTHSKLDLHLKQIYLMLNSLFLNDLVKYFIIVKDKKIRIPLKIDKDLSLFILLLLLLY